MTQCLNLSIELPMTREHDLHLQVHDAKQREAKMEATVSLVTPPQSDIPSLLPHSISHTDQPWH